MEGSSGLYDKRLIKEKTTRKNNKIPIISLRISPGIELGLWDQPILEAIIGIGGELIVMLLGGYLYWKLRGNDEKVTPPLLPFLLVGYLAVQVIALI